MSIPGCEKGVDIIDDANTRWETNSDQRKEISPETPQEEDDQEIDDGGGADDADGDDADYEENECLEIKDSEGGSEIDVGVTEIRYHICYIYISGPSWLSAFHIGR